MIDFLKRIFGMGSDGLPPVAPLEAFSIDFPNGHSPTAVKTPRIVNPASIIEALQLAQPTPTIFVSGGAGAMDTDSMNSSRATIEDGLTRFLQDHQVTLLDGGTSAGVMALIGVARQRRHYTFPLIGVAPDKVVWYPGRERDEQYIADLDAFHSHFVLTEGDDFGAESDTIINLAYTISGRGVRPRLCIVVNGGQIVKQEVHRMATREPRFPILVMEGTGRFADDLAQAYRKKETDDPILHDIVSKGNLSFLSIKAGAETLRNWLENFCGF